MSHAFHIGPEECEAIRRQYHKLLTQGYHPKAARRIVCEAADRVIRRKLSASGMGQDDENIFTQAAAIEPIKKAREAVSPWLWVISIISFGMTTLNTRRIARMFGSWKKKRRPA